ncbi:hypothetical protein TorRG33x02_320210, partial [Trema orientale]
VMASSSFSSPSNALKKHDVFLSFRGEDTRNGFLSHLKARLREKGIKTFIDDQQIEAGEFISPQLIQAIEDSRCSIIIISPRYASSSWCLIELVKILDCMKRMGQIVLPVFYHVNRSDVQCQTGMFGEAFSKYEGDSRIQIWRNALIEVANLRGFAFEDGDEAEFIRKIVAVLSSKLTSIRTSTSTSVASADIYEACFGLNPSVARLHSYLSTWLAGLRNICFAFFFFSRGFNQSQILIAAARV